MSQSTSTRVCLQKRVQGLCVVYAADLNDLHRRNSFCALAGEKQTTISPQRYLSHIVAIFSASCLIQLYVQYNAYRQKKTIKKNV